MIDVSIISCFWKDVNPSRRDLGRRPGRRIAWHPGQRGNLHCRIVGWGNTARRECRKVR